MNLRLVQAVGRAAAAVGLISGPMLEWIVTLQGSICVSADRARERLGWRPRFDSAGALLEFARRGGARKDTRG